MDKEYMKRWRAKKLAAGLCTSCGVTSVSGSVRCAACKARRKELRGKYKPRADLRQRIRGKVMEALGWKCACCGATERPFLTLDHSKDDGKRERKESLNLAMLRGVLKGERGDIRILCWNCNMGRAKNRGICPHQEDNAKEKAPQQQRAAADTAREGSAAGKADSKAASDTVQALKTPADRIRHRIEVEKLLTRSEQLRRLKEQQYGK